jgi:hypothetical protein
MGRAEPGDSHQWVGRGMGSSQPGGGGPWAKAEM